MKWNWINGLGKIGWNFFVFVIRRWTLYIVTRQSFYFIEVPGFDFPHFTWIHEYFGRMWFPWALLYTEIISIYIHWYPSFNLFVCDEWNKFWKSLHIFSYLFGLLAPLRRFSMCPVVVVDTRNTYGAVQTYIIMWLNWNPTILIASSVFPMLITLSAFLQINVINSHRIKTSQKTIMFLCIFFSSSINNLHEFRFE